MVGGVVADRLPRRLVMLFSDSANFVIRAVMGALLVSKLARVSAYNWLGAMAFVPLGYAIAGLVARVIGTSTSLWIGVVWIVVTTLIVIAVPDVRSFRLAAPDPERTELAQAAAAS